MQTEISKLDFKSGPWEDLKAIFKIRKVTFENRLKWNVSSIGPYEVDQFDTEETEYIAIRQMGEIKATCRMIPTSQPTMLSKVFPELLRGEKLRPDVVEISRLSSLDFKYGGAKILPSILQALHDYAKETGTDEFVFVTTTTIERLLLRYHLKIKRFGDGVVTDIGGVPSVAIRLAAKSIPSIH